MTAAVADCVDLAPAQHLVKALKAVRYSHSSSTESPAWERALDAELQALSHRPLSSTLLKDIVQGCKPSSFYTSSVLTPAGDGMSPWKYLQWQKYLASLLRTARRTCWCIRKGQCATHTTRLHRGELQLCASAALYTGSQSQALAVFLPVPCGCSRSATCSTFAWKAWRRTWSPAACTTRRACCRCELPQVLLQQPVCFCSR